MKKNYTKTVFKTKQEWLKAKEKTIGGSEAAAIVNKSKWLTINDIYNKMVLGKCKKVIENEKMADGIKAEPHIRALFALDHKEFKVKNPPRGYWFFARTDKPYLSCTPDGLLTKVINGALWGLEIKFVDLIKHEDKEMWENDTLPDQYLYQVLHDLVVITDMFGMVLNAHLKYYKKNDKGKYVFDYAVDKSYVIYRDEFNKSIAYLENRETDFFENNVKVRRRPNLVIKF